MKKFLLLYTMGLCLTACREHSVSMTGDEPVTISEFIQFFPEQPLPFRVADTSLTRPASDSMRIGKKVFAALVPDSILSAEFGKKGNPQIYALGRAREKGNETYLFAKAVQSSKKVVFLLCFGKDQQFKDALVLLRSGQGNAYGMLDNKFQVTTYVEKRKRNGEMGYKRNVYIFNQAAAEFSLILTEPNEEIIENVINPIDSFPRKNKLSGDYVLDKKNFISVRDAKRVNELRFFIHFEKDNGTCVGELKGMARVLKSNLAQYQESGNPCVIEFSFGPNSVSLKELGGCGTYRDIKCFFEGRYPKKPEPKNRGGKQKKP